MYRYGKTKIACYIASITGAVVSNLAPVLFVIFMDEFSLTYTQIGMLTFVNFITQLTVDAVSVRFVDKIGYRSSAVAAHIFASLGLIMMGVFSQAGYPVLIISVIVYAIGGGLIEVLTSPIVESLPSDCKSGQMSFFHSFYCWGQVLTVMLTTVAIKIFGSGVWRIACILWAIIPAFNAFLFTRVPLSSKLEAGTAGGIGQLFKKKFFIFALIMMLSAGASELTMSQWASAFAERGLGVSKVWGDLFGPCAFALLMGSARYLYGVFGNKIKIMPVLIASAVLCFICYIVAAVSDSGVLSLAACAVTGISVALMWPGVISLTCERIPGGGTAMFGLMAFFGDAGCAFGPWLCGAVADATQNAGAGILGASEGLYSGILIAGIFPLIMIAALLMPGKGNDTLQ